MKDAVTRSNELTFHQRRNVVGLSRSVFRRRVTRLRQARLIHGVQFARLFQLRGPALVLCRELGLDRRYLRGGNRKGA